MFERVLIQIIQQSRCTIYDLLHLRILAIEDPQRVAMKAPMSIFVKFAQMLFQIVDQPPTMEVTGFDTAQRSNL